MANLSLSKFVSFNFLLSGCSLAFRLYGLAFAQTQPLLQVEIGTNEQISILASEVSYGEVLRVLEKNLGWEIEIPALADELRISHVYVEATQPSTALAKLLEGSRLGYAMLTGVNQSEKVRVIVTFNTLRVSSAAEEAVNSSAIPDGVVAQAPSATRAQAVGATAIKPKASGGEATEKHDSLPTMPLTEAVNVMGVPAGVSPADVSTATTMPLTEAVNVMGVPAGVSPADVSTATTMPLSDAPNIMGVPAGMPPADVGSVTTLPLSGVAKMIGVPPGVSPTDVGKTITLPLTAGPGERP